MTHNNRILHVAGKQCNTLLDGVSEQNFDAQWILSNLLAEGSCSTNFSRTACCHILSFAVFVLIGSTGGQESVCLSCNLQPGSASTHVRGTAGLDRVLTSH